MNNMDSGMGLWGDGVQDTLNFELNFQVQGADHPVGSVLGKAWSLLPLLLQSAELKRPQTLGSPFTCFPASLGQKMGWWEPPPRARRGQLGHCLVPVVSRFKSFTGQKYQTFPVICSLC